MDSQVWHKKLQNILAYIFIGLYKRTKSCDFHFQFASPHIHIKWKINIQGCLLTIYQYQPISLQYSWLNDEQPISFVLASLGISNTAHKEIIPMLT